jgi:hypothetical protein
MSRPVHPRGSALSASKEMLYHAMYDSIKEEPLIGDMCVCAVYIYIYIYIYAHTLFNYYYMYACMHVYAAKDALCASTENEPLKSDTIYIYIYIYTHTHSHGMSSLKVLPNIYTYTHIHTHMHTYMQRNVASQRSNRRNTLHLRDPTRDAILHNRTQQTWRTHLRVRGSATRRPRLGM